MKRLTTFICFLLITCGVMNGKNDKETMLINVELSPILTKGIGVGFSHSFSQKWSICGTGYMWIGNILSSVSEIEDTHNNDFNESLNNDEIHTKDLYMSEIAIRFWPELSFKGHFISIGMRHSSFSKIDCIMEYGYRIPFGKGFGLSISIKAGLKALMKKEIINTQLINIGIGYAF